MSVKQLRLPAPAKLNLMLRVVGRRPDGYHLLQTVFQFFDLCDWIVLKERRDGRIALPRLLPGVPEELPEKEQETRMKPERSAAARKVD